MIFRYELTWWGEMRDASISHLSQSSLSYLMTPPPPISLRDDLSLVFADTAPIFQRLVATDPVLIVSQPPLDIRHGARASKLLPNKSSWFQRWKVSTPSRRHSGSIITPRAAGAGSSPRAQCWCRSWPRASRWASASSTSTSSGASTRTLSWPRVRQLMMSWHQMIIIHVFCSVGGSYLSFN